MYSRPDMRNTTDRLAHLLSEMHNDRAPIGWERYRPLAALLMYKLPITQFVDDPRFLDPDWQPGRDTPAPAEVTVGEAARERVQHIKRGTTYTILARGKLQTDKPLTDYAELVAYRCDETGDVWFRPQDEFTPDRFRAIAEDRT